MKENTREDILVQTFHLLDESDYSAISMAQIAERVGISKPAIYRHFSSKKALFEGVKTRFFDDLAHCLTKTDKDLILKIHLNGEVRKVFLRTLILFFSAKPQYLSFLLASISANPHFEQEILSAMKERGLTVQLDFCHKNFSLKKDKIPEYIHALYITASTVFFINEKKAVAPETNPELFAEKLCVLLYQGWKVLESAPNPDFQLLEKEACLSETDLPPESRIFTALSGTIEKYGFSGVTIERLSSRLGMAKSSLYTYFSNKNQLISDLITDEIRNFGEVLKSKLAKTANIQEAVYLHLQIMLSYLLTRPSTLTVCAWLRLRGTRVREKMTELFDNDSFTLYKETKNPDLGFSIKSFSMNGWISTLPISILIQCRLHKIPDEQLVPIMREVFLFMKNGLPKVVSQNYPAGGEKKCSENQKNQ